MVFNRIEIERTILFGCCIVPFYPAIVLKRGFVLKNNNAWSSLIQTLQNIEHHIILACCTHSIEKELNYHLDHGQHYCCMRYNMLIFHACLIVEFPTVKIIFEFFFNLSLRHNSNFTEYHIILADAYILCMPYCRIPNRQNHL